MAVQRSASETHPYSRRAFLKRMSLGAVGIAAIGITASRTLLRTRNGQSLPAQGSIFEPHRSGLVNRWKQRLERFRLH